MGSKTYSNLVDIPNGAKSTWPVTWLAGGASRLRRSGFSETLG
jgi:hypothetical protein